MSSISPADDPRICPLCKEPIEAGDKVWSKVVDGLPRDVHERCLPEETVKEFKERQDRLRNEASRVSSSPASSVKEVLRRRTILAEPEEFEPAVYQCLKCKDQGWRETKPDARGYTAAYECECSKRKRAEARVRALENSQRRFKDLSFDTYKPKHWTQKAALKRCREYVKRWPLVDGRGLLLYGPPGVGKSCLIKCIAVEVVKKAATEIQWYSATNIALSLRGTFDKESDAREEELIQKLSDAELLLLDDLGRENVSEYNKSVFFEFLNRRNAGMRPTLITTNLTDETTEKLGPDGRRRVVPAIQYRLGDALFSRLNEMCDFVFVNGKDRRRKGE